MSKESERLFEAMSQLRDSTIEEGSRISRRRPWRRWTALAACLCVAALGAGVYTGVIPLGGSSGGTGHQEGSTFLSYAGPVFPLTLGEADGAVTAQRALTLDFDPWVPQWWSNEAEAASREWLTEEERQAVVEQYDQWFPEGGRWETDDHILVTDASTLSNTAGEDRTVTVLYPFAASLKILDTLRPTLTLDGEALDTQLHVGAYSGGFEGAWNGQLTGNPQGSVNRNHAESWEDYQALLADGSYLANALGDEPDFTGVPVVVYKLTDPYSPAVDEEAGITNPTLRATFRLDYDQTTVLTYGFHGGSFDREGGTMIQDFSIPQPGEAGHGSDIYYLLVLGEDIQDLTLQGYADGSLDDDARALDGCGATVERYESNLDAVLREIMPLMMGSKLTDGARSVDFEVYYRAFREYLLSYGVLASQSMERYGAGWLESMDGDVWSVDRVCWLEAEITLPAGGSAALTASMTKQASYDFACSGRDNAGVRGYDLVTQIGSNLTFTGQTARLEDRGQIRIVRQSFGFDLEQGINTVTLEQGTEHYYLEVRRLDGTVPEGPPET